MFKKNIKIITALVIYFISTTIKTSDFSFWLPQNTKATFFNNETIKFKPGAYQNLIDKWQIRLTRIWDKFYINLQEETGITKEFIDTYLQDQNISQFYSTLAKKELDKLNEYTLEENIDEEILTFIKRTVQKYCTKKNIKIILSPNINATAATFGSDKGTHYIICNSNIYSKKNIKNYYDNKANNTDVFYLDQPSTKKFRFIEESNFLTTGLIETAAHIQHQSNLFTFLISHVTFCEKHPSIKTVQLGLYITEIRSILELILLSKNPLETAIFIGKVHNRTEKEHNLWKKLIKELADCYTPESLKIFKAIMNNMNMQYKK